MRCQIYKRLISRSLDGEGPFPRPVKRHLERCASCRDFARFSQSLAERMRRDADDLIEKSLGIRPEDILAKIELAPKTEDSSAQRRRFPFIPVISAAAIGLIAAAVIVFHPSAPTNPALFWEQIDALKKISAAGGPIPDLAAQAESPLNAEYRSLKKAVESAARSLLGRFDLKIGSKIV